MYPPKYYREDREEILIKMIRELKFGLLVTSSQQDFFEAVNVPVLVNESSDNIIIEAHVGIANPIWKDANNISVLAVFQGPHAYVHPNWYPTKKKDGKAVPTWNYISVQARGKMNVITDVDWLLRHVDELTQSTEMNKIEPWSIADAPDDYIDRMLNGIVGLEVRVNTLEGIWKLSQNHPEANRLGVINGLSESNSNNDQAVADIMREVEHPAPREQQ